MNSIKSYINHVILSKSYDSNLDKLLNSYRDDVIKRFDLSESKESYWIDCKDDYAEAPEMVNEKTDFHGSLEDQSNFVIKHWNFFPKSVHQELKGILRYILYLRNSSAIRNKYTLKYRSEVRDNVYEM